MPQTQETTGATRIKGPFVVTLRGAGSLGHDAQTVGAGSDIAARFQVPTGQTANCVTIEKPDGTVIYSIDANGNVTSNNKVAGKALGVAHAIYSFAVDGGAISTITPVSTDSIPANAIMVGATVNPTTAPVGTGASVAVGTSAGSSSSSILTATAITSLTIDALVNGTVTLAAPVKLSAAGNITVTISGAALTAGIIEIFVYYVQATNA